MCLPACQPASLPVPALLYDQALMGQRQGQRQREGGRGRGRGQAEGGRQARRGRALDPSCGRCACQAKGTVAATAAAPPSPYGAAHANSTE